MKWDKVNEDGECDQLLTLVEVGWDWQWPGWSWVAKSLNRDFGNNRSASACRNKYYQLNPPVKRNEESPAN